MHNCYPCRCLCITNRHLLLVNKFLLYNGVALFSASVVVVAEPKLMCMD